MKLILNNCTHRCFLVAFTISMSVACSTNYGHFNVGNARLLSAEKTKDSLNEQMSTVKEKRENGFDPFGVTRGHFTSENISNRVRIKGDPAGGVPDLGNNLEPQTIGDATEIVKIDPSKFPYKGLMMDQFSDLESFSAHKVNIFENYDIETIALDEKSSLLKVKFDLWIEPTRQDYLSYSWRWLTIPFNKGFENFTKDYHAEIKIKLSNSVNFDYKIIMVQPVNEGINSHDMSILSRTTQLIGGAAWQGVAAEVDLAERQRQQFVEQRKYPIIRGTVDSDTAFHFIISPRQHVEQRFFRIPFLMSRYSLERRLDYGPYNVSAFIKVTNKNDLKKLELPFKISADYKKFGNPRFNNDYDNEEDDSDPKIPFGLEKFNAKNTNDKECSKIKKRICLKEKKLVLKLVKKPENSQETEPKSEAH